ncbi:MAG: large repetitive protein [Thermoplasmata archaeon]|jgi:hypothetical protein|nr:large repetitive protein [Thermoplasmata archaeon]
MLNARTATVLSLAIAGAFVLFATPTSAHGHAGDVKVHDEETADPPTRNIPHVDCEDFWIEGFNMNAGTGSFEIFSWPPTGDMTMVLDGEWTADTGDDEEGFHFLSGPYTLAAGHYRLEVTEDDGKDSTKNKMFWVEECAPECEEGSEQCPPPEELPCPTDLVLLARSDGSVELTFTPAPGSNGTMVYRAEGDGDFEHIANLDAGVGTYIDADTEDGVTYTYMVTALFGDSESEGCAQVEVTTIPDLPTFVAVGAAGLLGTAAYAIARRKQE